MLTENGKALEKNLKNSNGVLFWTWAGQRERICKFPTSGVKRRGFLADLMGVHTIITISMNNSAHAGVCQQRWNGLTLLATNHKQSPKRKWTAWIVLYQVKYKLKRKVQEYRASLANPTKYLKK